LLTEAAANALLKTLEEPPEKTWFSSHAVIRDDCWRRCAAAVVFITSVPQESWALSWLEREVTTSQEVRCPPCA
jgi:DNA polymerase-3 subunit delta'